jgi:hypothetical protein
MALFLLKTMYNKLDVNFAVGQTRGKMIGAMQFFLISASRKIMMQMLMMSLTERAPFRRREVPTLLRRRIISARA